MFGIFPEEESASRRAGGLELIIKDKMEKF